MTVQELIKALQQYPREAEVSLGRVFADQIDDKVFDIGKVKLSEVVYVDVDTVIADVDDIDAEVRVILFPEI